MAQNVQINISFNAKGNADEQVDKLKKNLGSINNIKFGGFSSAFSKIGASIVVANQALQLFSSIARTVSGSVGFFINEASKIEDLSVKFEVLTGSIENAERAVSDLQDFASATPFRLEELARASQTLLSFGFSQDAVIGKLKELGDVSAATGKNLGELTVIYSQIQSASKLTLERLNQLVEGGVNVLPALAKTLGVAESEVRGLITAGKVTNEVFQEAFSTLNKEGGIAFGGLSKLSETLSGRISTLEDNWSQLAATIGKELLPFAKALVTSLTEIIQRNKDLIKTKVTAFIKSAALGLANIVGLVAKLAPLLFVLTSPIKLLVRTLFAAKKAALEAVKSLSDFLSLGTGKSRGARLQADIDSLNELIKLVDADLQKSADAWGAFEDGAAVSSKLIKDIVKSTEKLEKDTKKSADNLTKASKAAATPVNRTPQGTPASAKPSTTPKKSQSEINSDAGVFAKAFEKLGFGDDIGKNIGKGLSLVGEGATGARKLVSEVGDAILPGLGQALDVLGRDPAEFRKVIDSFIQALIDIPQNIVENIPFIIERFIERLPDIIESLINLTPRLIAALITLLTDPGFWIRVTNALIKSFINSFNLQIGDIKLFEIFDDFGSTLKDFISKFKPLIDAIEAVADVIKDISQGGPLGGAAKKVGGIFGKIGGAVGGAVGGIVGGLFAEGGDVPDLAQFKNDKFPARLSAGEAVLSPTTSDKLRDFLDNQGSNQGQNLNITLQVGENELASVLLDLNQKGFRVA